MSGTDLFQAYENLPMQPINPISDKNNIVEQNQSTHTPTVDIENAGQGVSKNNASFTLLVPNLFASICSGCALVCHSAEPFIDRIDWAAIIVYPSNFQVHSE